MTRVVLGTWWPRFPMYDDDVIAIDIRGQTIARTGFGHIRLSSQRMQLALILLSTPLGHIADHNDTIEALFGDREDGGPEYANNVMSVIITYLRVALAPLGIDIKTEWGRGHVIELRQPAGVS